MKAMNRFFHVSPFLSGPKKKTYCKQEALVAFLLTNTSFQKTMNWKRNTDTLNQIWTIATQAVVENTSLLEIYFVIQ